MLKPGFQTSEVRTGLGTIVAALAAAAAIIFPDQAGHLAAEDIVAAAKDVKELASGLQLQFAQYVTTLLAKYGTVGGIFVFVYKVWSRMSGDRTLLKIEEIKAKIAERKADDQSVDR